MAPLFPSFIKNFRIVPAKGEYQPGENVVFTGYLEGRTWFTEFYPLVGEEIHVLTDTVEAGIGRTDSKGVFAIPVLLPFTPGTYAYRAFFAGADWGRAIDGNWSDTVLVKVVQAAVPITPPLPVLPPLPVSLPVIIIVAAGAVSIGLIAWGATK